MATPTTNAMKKPQTMQKLLQPIQKVLDPTKMGTWNIVRRPPIENNTVIQGRPRQEGSNAFRTHQAKEGVRLRKALQALTHGKNIFVYHNMRTNQVVYSLTRYLDKNNVLRQMVYHGKKTVPATLRKDMWVPYYSVHFDQAQVGLRAYHLLREFAMQRQLAPPREMITITEAWLAQKRPRDPNAAEEFNEKWNDKVGWLMKPKDRARALMDQKATSVADVAAVLAIQQEEIKDGFAGGQRGYLTRTARRRRRAARAKEAAVAVRQAERVAAFEDALSLPNVRYKVQEVVEDDAVSRALQEVENPVKILWTDVHDARFAAQWPDRVRHGELDLSRDHVMPGQKPIYDDIEVLADNAFKEKGVQADETVPVKN
ncbi:mitochondrial 54S ribosomal protein mL67 [Aspergillus homomorphus CBS 101889]|uniref:Large ribosomal subunit protein mL67 n=1 Tax=Aspergillus homomorphus (strain CBS 101889) TaxID=1450537 RepID=A0A395I483_ASPHC|nr:hypothetical protein BO97DRAFT_468986 [Aspergillus homomorphus CBS 101889]RAL14575.1 hypothetical protein BO97DRAFT_468986 [Aspergillus homomorphus CBS 101889]